MKLLGTINENDFEPQDYTVRKTVRLVILNDRKDKVLFFGSNLVGGGVEEGESDEEAAMREAMEEAGARIEILEHIGEVIGYRDFLKKKYVIHGYLCRQVGDFQQPTTTDLEEQKEKIQWIDFSSAVQKFEERIVSLTSRIVSPAGDDLLQSKLHNCKASLIILQQAIEMMK